MKYYDETCYRFHENDIPDKCFCCGENTHKLMIVRHIDSMMLVHLCHDCMTENISNYLLDNTKPWRSAK